MYVYTCYKQTHLHNLHQHHYDESTARYVTESVYWNTLVAGWILKYIEHYSEKLDHFQYQRRHLCVLCHLDIKV